MTESARERVATRLGVTAALIAALAFAIVMRDREARSVAPVSGPVLASWVDNAARAAAITVKTSDRTLRIRRDSDGVWTLQERANHPVSPRAFARLDAGLRSLRFQARKTADPAKHARLGLTDPEAGGAATRLRITDEDGRVIADLLLGAERSGGGRYLRFYGGDQTYAVMGDLPSITQPVDWLNLDLLPLISADIESVRVVPPMGQPYTLSHFEPGTLEFKLTRPEADWTLKAPEAATAVASAVTRLVFADVRPARELPSNPVVRHAATTFEGLRVTLLVYPDGSDRWAVVSAGAKPSKLPEFATPPARTKAIQINARADGWAFKLSPKAAALLETRLDDLAFQTAQPFVAAPAPPAD